MNDDDKSTMNVFCSLSLFVVSSLLFAPSVVCDYFQVRTIQLAHILSMEDHLTGANPDPGCSITMRLSWLSQNSTACIFKEDDATGVVPFVSDVISTELGDAPSNPSVIVWLDCFENDCGSGCVFDESCKIGLTGLLTQEDDVRERGNATFAFVSNRTDTADFKLQLYTVRFELLWIPSAPGVTPAPGSLLVTPAPTAAAPVATTTNGNSMTDLTGGGSSTTTMSSPSSNTLAIAIGAAVGAVLLLGLLLGGALFMCKRRSRSGSVSLNEIEVAEQTATNSKQAAQPYIGFNPISATAERSATLQEWESDAARISIAKAKANAPPMSTIGKYDSVPEVGDE